LWLCGVKPHRRPKLSHPNPDASLNPDTIPHPSRISDINSNPDPKANHIPSPNLKPGLLF